MSQVSFSQLGPFSSKVRGIFYLTSVKN